MKKNTITGHKLIQCAVLSVVLCCFCGGCATWSQHGVFLDSGKARIAVLPVQNTVTIKRLRDIETPQESTAISTNEQELIDRRMRDIAERIGQRIQDGLNQSYFFETVSHEQLLRAGKTLGTSLMSPLTADQVEQLGKSLDADAVLVVKVSGYGKIKRKWFYLLIGSGVVEGIVQGVAAAAIVDNVWVAVGVATEEFLQEGLTWGGGTYLFNRIFTPVIIEAKLISVKDGEIIWGHTAFARRDRKALKKLPKAEQRRKEVRLRLTAEKAIADLLANLDKKAFKNIEYRSLGEDVTEKSRFGIGTPIAERPSPTTGHTDHVNSGPAVGDRIDQEEQVRASE